LLNVLEREGARVHGTHFVQFRISSTPSKFPEKGSLLQGLVAMQSFLKGPTFCRKELAYVTNICRVGQNHV